MVYLRVDSPSSQLSSLRGFEASGFRLSMAVSRFTRRFERMVFDDSMQQTIAAAAEKHAISWHQAARIEYAMLERYDRYRGTIAGISDGLVVDENLFWQK